MANQEYWYASDGNLYNWSPKVAQTFTASSSYTLETVSLKLAEGLYTTGDATVYLYATDGDSKPTGGALVTIGNISSADLTDSAQWIEFTGLSYDLTSDTEYAIVIEIDSYNSTYEDEEDIPAIQFQAEIGYDGWTWREYYSLVDGTWTLQTGWTSDSHDIAFIMESVDALNISIDSIDYTEGNDYAAINFTADSNWSTWHDNGVEVDGNLSHGFTEVWHLGENKVTLRDLSLDTTYAVRVAGKETLGDAWSYSDEQNIVTSSPDPPGQAQNPTPTHNSGKETTEDFLIQTDLNKLEWEAPD